MLFRSLLRRNEDLVVTACKPWSTEEQFELLHRYLKARHPGGGMTEMDEMDFADMVEQTPVDSYVIEYREQSENGIHGRLVGAFLSARQGYELTISTRIFDHHPYPTPNIST